MSATFDLTRRLEFSSAHRLFNPTFSAEKNRPTRGSQFPGLSNDTATPDALPTIRSRLAIPK